MQVKLNVSYFLTYLELNNAVYKAPPEKILLYYLTERETKKQIRYGLLK